MSMTGLSQNNSKMFRISRYFWTAMDWLYPPHCVNCDKLGFVLCEPCFHEIEVLSEKVCKKCGYPVLRKQSLCEECRSKSPDFSEMRSWAKFSGVVREAIHALKYHQNLALGAVLAQPLVKMIRTSGWSIDLIVPIPLSRSHLKQRGYNQAATISRQVAWQLNIPHSTQAIKRSKETITQISLDVNERLMNLMDAFYGIPAKLEKRNVLVIDDVITTGATMKNCANALLQAGAEKVYCLSVARTLLRHSKTSEI